MNKSRPSAHKQLAEYRQLIADQQLRINALTAELQRILPIARDLQETARLAISQLRLAIPIWREHAPHVNTAELEAIEGLLAGPVPVTPPAEVPAGTEPGEMVDGLQVVGATASPPHGLAPLADGESPAA